MKTVVRTAIVLATLIALTGCYVALDNGSGEVGIVLPDPRSASETATADVARIYVLNGPNLVPVGDGTDYAEFDLSPSEGESLTEATVGPVPSGGGYQVVLVFGDEVDYGTGDVTGLGGAGFNPTQYAVSDLFTVNAGQATVTDVDLVATPFVTLDGADTAGENLIDLVFDGSAIYTSTNTQVLSMPTALGDLESITIDLDEHPGFSLRTGETTINSLNVGANDNGPLAFVNTNIGIQALNSAGVVAGFDADLPGKPLNVLSSAGQDFGGAYAAYGYFQVDGGFGGYRTNGVTPAGPGDWMESVDLSDLVTGEAIFDLAVANDGTNFFGYFATKLGSFRVPETVLDDGALTSTEIFNDYAEFFRVIIGGNPALVTQIGVRDGGSHVYLGTKRGAVRVPITDMPASTGSVAAAVIDDQAVIAGTQNQEVRDIVVSGSLVVILTDHFVTVSQDGGVTWKSVPTYAGASGGANAILVDSSTPGIVVVAGPQGLSAFNVTKL